MPAIVHLLIGSTVLSVVSSDRKMIALIRKTYARFLTHKTPGALPVAISIDPALSADPYTNGFFFKTTFSLVGDTVCVNGNIFSGSFQEDGGGAEMRIARSVEAFTLFLRCFLSLVLLRTDGLLIHASSVVEKGYGYLFAGKPDAGKSTIVTLSRGREILSDEHSLVRREQGAWYVYPSPFWSDFVPGKHLSARTRIPLAGVYVLCKSDETYCRPIRSFARKANLFHSNVFFLPGVSSMAEQAFLLEAALLEEIPVSLLYFSRTAALWENGAL